MHCVGRRNGHCMLEGAKCNTPFVVEQWGFCPKEVWTGMTRQDLINARDSRDTHFICDFLFSLGTSIASISSCLSLFLFTCIHTLNLMSRESGDSRSNFTQGSSLGSCYSRPGFSWFFWRNSNSLRYHLDSSIAIRELIRDE